VRIATEYPAAVAGSMTDARMIGAVRFDQILRFSLADVFGAACPIRRERALM